jgi:hypothetical protein
VRDLTAAVFATEAPRYTTFFPASSLDLPKARRGQELFNEYCARCHGTYRKGWEDGAEDPFATTAVGYHAKTPVIDVGTDPGRYRGMAGFANRLNELKISHSLDTVVEVQRGYVPPPLVGIWARWPYFHNNAAPTLCAVLTRAEDRPAMYYMGEPIDRQTDFDADCNGYPSIDRAPRSWQTAERLYDTRKPGLSNRGHDEGIFLRDGQEMLTPTDKQAVIEFLKTL